MSKGSPLSLLLVGIILISLTFLTIYGASSQLIFLTKEDGVIENFGSVFFLVASILFFLTFFRTRKSNDYQINKHLGTWVFFLFGLMFFFAFGEEISWGQRIFGFATPEDMKAANVQDEFNVHNLDVFYGEGLTTALITPIRLFALFGLVYMLILPWAVPRIPFLQRLVTNWSIPIPASYIPGVLFMYNLIFCKALQSMVIVERNLVFRGMAELMEAILALLIMLMAYEFYKNPYPKRENSEPAFANQLPQ